MGKLGVGFIGSDVHISGYVKAFLANSEVELIGAFDRDEKAAKMVADLGNMGLSTTDLGKLLSDEKLDAVLVCSPDHFHAEDSIAALKAGKHVLCEKPMTDTLQDCKNMVKAVDESGLTFMVSQYMRFNPLCQAIKKALDEGTIGRPFFVEGSYIHDMQSLYEGGNWRADPKKPQSILTGGGCHPLDLLRWGVGSEIEEVHAYSNGYAAPYFPLDDCYISTFKFANGCIGKVFVTSGCKGHGMGEGFFSVYGTNGTIWRNQLYPAKGGVQDIPHGGGNAVQGSVDHFVDCAINGKEPIIDVRDGAKTASALIAGIESAESGKPVKVFNDF